MVKCLILEVASVVFVWNPVRPGALVKKVGNMMIVNQSVRILLSFENVTHVRDTTVDDIQATIIDISANLEQLSLNHSNLQESLDIFLLIDQMHLKLLEIHSDMETFIQDLVLANSGHVTSTLLSIPQLIKIIHSTKTDWNFKPFFDETNIALYYSLLNSYINGSSVIIDIPFSS